MLVNTPHDFLVFLGVFLCGVCIGVVFDIFRALRKVHTPGTGFLAFQDALFCAIAFSLFSHTVTQYADGDLRWYVFAGLFFGLALYFLTIGKFVLSIFAKCFMIVRKSFCAVSALFEKIISFVSRPFLCVITKIKEVFLSFKEKMTGSIWKNRSKKCDNGAFSEKIFKKIFTTQKK